MFLQHDAGLTQMFVMVFNDHMLGFESRVFDPFISFLFLDGSVCVSFNSSLLLSGSVDSGVY